MYNNSREAMSATLLFRGLVRLFALARERECTHGALRFANLLLVVGLSSSLLYFYFASEHRGALGVATKVGIWFLMISFGASFGYTVMSRISLAIGRARSLMDQGSVAAILAVAVVIALFVWSRRAGAETAGGGENP